MTAADGSATGAPGVPPDEVADQPQEAEVAADEVSSNGSKVLTFTPKEGAESIELQLPEKLLGSVVFRAGILRDDDIAGASRLVQAVIGAEQFDRVMDHMDSIGVTTDDEEGMTCLGVLLNDALAQFAVTEGESEASSES